MIQPAYFHNLTCLRGMAALVVAVFHLNEIIIKFVPNETTLFLRHGYLYVDLFFIISGFVILHVYNPQVNGEWTKTSYTQFLRARLARIYPMHILILIILGIAGLITGQTMPSNNLYTFVSNVFMTHALGLHDLFSWNVPSWSISAEWWCYVLFPLMTWVWVRLGKSYFIFALALAFCIYLAIVYAVPRVNFFAPNSPRPQDLDVTYDYGFFRGLAGFLIGTAIYSMHRYNFITSLFKSKFIFYGLLMLGLPILHFNTNDIVICVYWSLIVMSAVVLEKNQDFRLLKHKWLLHLGDISYSIYMIHSLILFTCVSPICAYFGYSGGPMNVPNIGFLQGLGFTIIYLAILIPISTLTYYHIEVKARKWLNK